VRADDVSGAQLSVPNRSSKGAKCGSAPRLLSHQRGILKGLAAGQISRAVSIHSAIGGFAMRTFSLLLAVSIVLSACVQTRYTLVNPTAQSYEPVAPEQVWIVTSEAELDTLEYARVAIIEATGSGEWTDQTKMIEAIRKRAGELGANAVLLPQINEPGAGAKVAAAIFGTGTQRKGSAVAIRVLGKKEEPDGSGSMRDETKWIPTVYLALP